MAAVGSHTHLWKKSVTATTTQSTKMVAFRKGSSTWGVEGVEEVIIKEEGAVAVVVGIEGGEVEEVFGVVRTKVVVVGGAREAGAVDNWSVCGGMRLEMRCVHTMKSVPIFHLGCESNLLCWPCQVSDSLLVVVNRLIWFFGLFGFILGWSAGGFLLFDRS